MRHVQRWLAAFDCELSADRRRWDMAQFRKPGKFRSHRPSHRVLAAAATLTLHTVAITIPMTLTLSHTHVAGAQSATTGAISGVVKDVKTGELMVGVTVVVTGKTLRGTQAAVTDENGAYLIADLPPGKYQLEYFYAEAHVIVKQLVVKANSTTVNNAKIDANVKSEVIRIEAKAPMIDATTATQGSTISKDILANLPVRGRTFGAVAGTLGDSVGVSISGSTSVQNSYVVDGINTSGAPATAAPGTPGTPAMPRDTSNERYDARRDNPFFRVADAPFSTFSTDVDTASYSNFRRMMREKTEIPAGAVRVEEWLNYFRYSDVDNAQLTPLRASARSLHDGVAGEPIAIQTEVSQSPWHPGLQLLRVALRAPEMPQANVAPRNLVFLIDVSGSMQDPDKLPLLQKGLALLVENLRPIDRVSIVVYAGSEGLALPSTPGNQRTKINDAINALSAGGSTNGAAGIELAYAQAEQNFIKDGINRVILCTDGDFNVGVTSQAELTKLIERKREHGVFLTALGFGIGNFNDSTMEMLADKGNGNYSYIDSVNEAHKVLVKEAGATLVTVAKDVKLQLEFNPATVAGYRLIGYENRLLADEDFNDDKKDAGDMGAGHTVTALYEVVPAGVTVPGPRVDPRRYGVPPAPSVATPATHTNELLTVKVRYKAPTKAVSKLISRTVGVGAVPLAQASESMRWAAAVATTAALVRQSGGAGDMTLADATKLARSAIGADRDGYRKEFVALLEGGGPLLQAMAPLAPPRTTDWPGDDVSIAAKSDDYVILLPAKRPPTPPYVINTQRTADLHHKGGSLSFAAMCFNGVGQCER